MAKLNPPLGEAHMKSMKSTLIISIVLLGADDEVFDTGKYRPLAGANPETKTVILPGLNHNSVLNSYVTYEKLGQWLESL
jgi:hypothetical protein